MSDALCFDERSSRMDRRREQDSYGFARAGLPGQLVLELPDSLFHMLFFARLDKSHSTALSMKSATARLRTHSLSTPSGSINLSCFCVVSHTAETKTVNLF
jgi:hypothetical protein